MAWKLNFALFLEVLGKEKLLLYLFWFYFVRYYLLPTWCLRVKNLCMRLCEVSISADWKANNWKIKTPKIALSSTKQGFFSPSTQGTNYPPKYWWGTAMFHLPWRGRTRECYLLYSILQSSGHKSHLLFCVFIKYKNLRHLDRLRWFH